MGGLQSRSGHTGVALRPDLSTERGVERRTLASTAHLAAAARRVGAAEAAALPLSRDFPPRPPRAAPSAGPQRAGRGGA